MKLNVWVNRRSERSKRNFFHACSICINRVTLVESGRDIHRNYRLSKPMSLCLYEYNKIDATSREQWQNQYKKRGNYMHSKSNHVHRNMIHKLVYNSVNHFKITDNIQIMQNGKKIAFITWIAMINNNGHWLDLCVIVLSLFSDFQAQIILLDVYLTIKLKFVCRHISREWHREASNQQ